MQAKKLEYYLGLIFAYGRFEKSQWDSPKKLTALKQKRLRNLINHAYENVPYYHRVMKERNIRPSNIRKEEDLIKLPIIDKKTIRKNFQDFHARNFQKYYPVLCSTGGSTGEPLQFYKDIRRMAINDATILRGYRFAGWTPFDKIAVLSGLRYSKPEIFTLRREYRFPTVSLTTQRMYKYAQEIEKLKPNFIRGYPSSVEFFTSFLRKHDHNLNIQLKAVLTSGEQLLDHQRKKMEEFFDCEVFDGYGCPDGGITAFECSYHEGLHLSVENSILEFVQDDRQVEKGEIIATDLENYSMPMIRYRTGDVGKILDHSCSCGRKLPLIAVEGRIRDLISFDNGVTLTGQAITLLFKDLDVEQYQIVQTTRNTLLINIVKGVSFTQKDVEHLMNKFKEICGKSVNVEINFVDEVTPTPVGKRLFIISNLMRET